MPHLAGSAKNDVDVLVQHRLFWIRDGLTNIPQPIVPTAEELISAQAGVVVVKSHANDHYARYGRHLVSADSMAWSFRGRYAGACHHERPGRRPAPISEANCRYYAQHWRRQILASLPAEAAANDSKVIIGEHAA
jgi:hypothetical protein